MLLLLPSCKVVATAARGAAASVVQKISWPCKASVCRGPPGFPLACRRLPVASWVVRGTRSRAGRHTAVTACRLRGTLGGVLAGTGRGLCNGIRCSGQRDEPTAIGRRFVCWRWLLLLLLALPFVILAPLLLVLRVPVPIRLRVRGDVVQRHGPASAVWGYDGVYSLWRRKNVALSALSGVWQTLICPRLAIRCTHCLRPRAALSYGVRSQRSVVGVGLVASVLFPEPVFLVVVFAFVIRGRLFGGETGNVRVPSTFHTLDEDRLTTGAFDLVSIRRAAIGFACRRWKRTTNISLRRRWTGG